MSQEGDIKITTKLKDTIDVPIISQENSVLSSGYDSEKSATNKKRKSALQGVGQNICKLKIIKINLMLKF